MHCSKIQSLFDHSVGATEQRERESDAERLGGLEVYVQLDFCGLLDRQIGWFFAFENSAGVDADLTVRIGKTASVAPGWFLRSWSPS